MDWRKKLFKLPGRITKESWIVLLCLGLIMMILAMPLSKKAEGERTGTGNREEGNREWTSTGKTNTNGKTGDLQNSVKDMFSAEELTEEMLLSGETLSSYETVLEGRVKDVLKKVEGVGQVDVLIVLKSSEERIYRTDGKTSQSSTKEVDAAGGSREVSEQEEERTTVLSAGGGSVLGEKESGPLLEKELRPEISGIVISAQGGGSPSVKAEITEAMEALFGLPAHKIKILKRVE